MGCMHSEPLNPECGHRKLGAHGPEASRSDLQVRLPSSMGKWVGSCVHCLGDAVREADGNAGVTCSEKVRGSSSWDSWQLPSDSILKFYYHLLLLWGWHLRPLAR